MTETEAVISIAVGLLFCVLAFAIKQFHWALRGANISSREMPRWAGRLLFLFVGVLFLYIGFAFLRRGQP